MKKAHVMLLTAFIVLTVSVTVTAQEHMHTRTKYEPTWESLDARPLPAWYDEAKIGIFLHWGVFSVPSFQGAWFWKWWRDGLPTVVEFMKKNYPPTWTYADFAPHFTAEFFNPDTWAEIFNASGARYVVLTSKHHEGFCNWPSKYCFNWNSWDVGPKRDLVGDLAKAVRKYPNLHFGLYHSMFEFYHPLWLQDQQNNFTTQEFVAKKALPELHELINAYKPEVLWSDGCWLAPYTYWNATQFLAWLYNDSPVRDIIAVNDRWGTYTKCTHGGYYTCTDKYNPGVLQKHKFEDATTIEKYAWSYRRTATIDDFNTMEDITYLIASVISCGGNLLLNVGPTADGRITPVFEERLRQMGQWLGVNGEAIYSSRPWTFQNDTFTEGVWYTSKKGESGLNVYAIVLDWPKEGVLYLEAPMPSSSTQVSMLGYPSPFQWQAVNPRGMIIIVPPIPFNKMPCMWAWVFKLQGLKN